MFLVCLGRTSVDPTDQGGAGLLFGTHYQDAWDDLVQEVIIISTEHFRVCFSVGTVCTTYIAHICLWQTKKDKKRNDRVY